jgi:hypothetical protein
VRFCFVDVLHAHVYIFILDSSPAESAGLVPYGDWVIGWSGGVLSAEGDFYEVVEAVSHCTAPQSTELIIDLAHRQVLARLCLLA